MKSFVALFTAITFNALIGLAMAMAINISPIVPISGMIGLGVAQGLVKSMGYDFGAGSFLVGVNKEVWLPEIMEGFYPDNTFLSKSRDLTAFVENDKINLAEAGADPAVLYNNNVWPIPINQRVDINHDHELGVLDTENTLVRNVEATEAAYDKMASVAGQHRKALMKQAAQRAAHAYGPDADSADTPVILTSGATVGGRKIVTFNDIIDLADKFDGNEWNGDRVLLLPSKFSNQLRKEDLQLFKTAMSEKKQGFDLFGFTTFIYNFTPTYDHLAGTKKAFGAAPGANDSLSAIAYLSDEVFRADGTVEMFLREKDPEQRGDIIGFQKRFLAGALRSKALAALYESA